LASSEIIDIFNKTYLQIKNDLELVDFTISKTKANDITQCELVYMHNDKQITSKGEGNGPIDACKNALTKEYKHEFSIKSYSEHSRGEQSSADAVAYIEIETPQMDRYFGVGIDSNITMASIKALFCALNRAFL